MTEWTLEYEAYLMQPLKALPVEHPIILVSDPFVCFNMMLEIVTTRSETQSNLWERGRVKSGPAVFATS